MWVVYVVNDPRARRKAEEVLIVLRGGRMFWVKKISTMDRLPRDLQRIDSWAHLRLVDP